MNQFFEELRSQSRGTREFLFGLCVVITVSLAGTLWFQSFEERLFVGLNPDPEIQKEFYAQRETTGGPSLLSGIGSVVGSLRATLVDALGFVLPDTEVEINNTLPGAVHPFPISKDK